MNYKTIIKRILLLIVILIIWDVTSQRVNNLFIPRPYKVFEDFVISIKNGSLYKATIYSLRRIVIATLLSSVIAIPAGLLTYNVTLFNDILHPIANIIRYLPVTAFYPLLIMWF